MSVPPETPPRRTERSMSPVMMPAQT
jgi:hypothetical protein